MRTRVLEQTIRNGLENLQGAGLENLAELEDDLRRTLRATRHLRFIDEPEKVPTELEAAIDAAEADRVARGKSTVLPELWEKVLAARRDE